MSAWPRLQPARLEEIGASDLLIRFAFGALISIVAGVVSLLWNAKAGGMFLAFPAILPATLTLIEKKQSKREAEEDDEGAILGSVAMFAFAATATWTLTALPAGLSLAAAGTAWLSAAVLLYIVVVVGARGVKNRR
jgi:hypothetical protein